MCKCIEVLVDGGFVKYEHGIYKVDVAGDNCSLIFYLDYCPACGTKLPDTNWEVEEPIVLES